MSKLEQRIRALSLRAPDQSLDDRILSALRQPDAAEPTELSRAEKSVTADKDEFSPALHTNRRGTVVTSGWIVASVSMMIGTVIGNAMPSLSSLHANRDIPINPDQTARIAGTAYWESASGSEERRVSEPDNSIATENTQSRSGAVASQIVESIWISPTAAAVAWEQQTGQIFNVANHVNDRRFDMCRDCHRVGG